MLILERGDFVPREQENWDPEEVWKKLRYRAKERWLDERGKEWTPYTHYGVGGNTKFWGSVLYRLRRGGFCAPAPTHRNFSPLAHPPQTPPPLLQTRRRRGPHPRPGRA